MLNADLALLNEVEAWTRAKNRPKRKIITKSKSKTRPKKKVEEDSGFHYVAYVPIAGAVWKLDGLQRTPVKIGKLTLPHSLNLC